MPEGPQMMFTKEQMQHFVGQKTIAAKGNTTEIPFERVVGQTLVDIRTFGKELLFCFKPFTIRIHMMLFGKYAIDQELNRQLRLNLTFEGGELNFYSVDCRFIEVPLDDVYDWSIDIMNKAFDVEKAVKKLQQKPAEMICEALLDQQILAGVGNKLKTESLYRQQVHPESLVGEIPKAKLKKLVQSCVSLSFDYLQWKREGNNDGEWQAYKKTECMRDHIPLQKVKIGKSRRTNYFCDKCQKLYVKDDL